MSEKENVGADAPIDVEVFAKDGREVPANHPKYKIRIDKAYFVVDHAVLTGRQILDLVHKTPEEHILLVKSRHGDLKEVKPDERVNLAAPGVERFQTMPRAVQDGLTGTLRRQFRLPEGDEEALDQAARPWETVKEGESRYVLIHDFALPSGYTVERACAAVLLGPNYPAEQIDMVFFNPPLTLRSGKSIPSLSDATIDGKSFQRWSRHRPGSHPWIADEYNIVLHLAQVTSWLERELAR